MLKATTRHGFWCECWTQRLDGRRPPALFGSFDAYSAVEANNWVATILRTISPALDTAASQAAWTRLQNDRIDTRRALLRREPWTVSVTHVRTRITRTGRPAMFLPLAHRQGRELPACADDFKPRTTD
ncbi:hypothetical protein ELQ87_20995 [Streptomyces griseoviridis]|uniref:Uncharacterized protein n=1 Tax=Streptomyces griseoviridis TaxID=45398 RepID=A0A3S9ZF90_STRGD|nr:hypothetical protein [Streptomyces griseoviridis]AZS86452.1 hypothetical protein ELQ87_20995 [Streptomyces griseoviridis]QCN86683.1 hypothetical protein DDJ31_18280 [Streptomyces griseoviridis]